MNALAVKTDETGSFDRPTLLGNCEVRMTDNAHDYSRQFAVTVAKPRSIPAQDVDLNGRDATREVNFRAD